MKQLFQSYRDGEVRLTEVPVARPGSGTLLIQTACSLVSVGTEKHMLELARKSLLGKALARPDLARQVMAKARSEGIAEAYRQAMGRLDTPVPLGYSSAGMVIEVGEGVNDFRVGDRVACAGSGWASHAELVCVPLHLCVRIPEGVGFDAAAFVALGGIALEAIRLSRASLGEQVAVVGLGLLGQVAVQLLHAAGCHVFGMDISAGKADLALEHGCEAVASDYDTLAQICRQRTAGHGVDATLIFAADSSNQPLAWAAKICRERGRIVAAGLVGLDVPRQAFYDKELELVVSRAWGPGLYDAQYTEKGLDYPLAYARWTAGRNLAEFLSQLARRSVRVDRLITHRFPFDRALEAYDLILEGKEPYIGVLLTFEGAVTSRDSSGVMAAARRVELPRAATARTATGRLVTIGLIGAGQFAQGTLLPAIKRLSGIRFRGIASSSGLKARYTAERFGFEYCTTEHRQLLDDPDIDLVFILTRHGSHARFVTESLQANKHVFVEKPLAVDEHQLQAIVEANKAAVYARAAQNRVATPILMVGFNRRFSPFTMWLKQQLAPIAEPLAVHCTVNAGLVPPGSWLHDPEEGAGRIIGEVCHFVDLIQFLTDSVPQRVFAETLVSRKYQPSDNVMVTLKMSNGAIGSVTYVAGGDKRFPRERVEMIGGGAVGVIEDFGTATFTRQGRTKRIRNWFSVDRGHRAELTSLISAIRTGGPSPVAFEDYLWTTRATFAIEESLRSGLPAPVNGSDSS